VNVLFTSFPLDLRRIARSRAARVLACALALVLAATNVMAAAMPLGDHAAHAGKHENTSVSAPAHAHCADHGTARAPSAHESHPGHGADCPCCGKACACMHACDRLVLAMPPALALPSARIFAIAPPRTGAAIEAPLLRPPIG
jgi:hypothetical protein